MEISGRAQHHAGFPGPVRTPPARSLLPSAAVTPSWTELLSGPFVGLSIYPRAAVLKPRVAVLLLIGSLALAGALLAGVFQVRMGRALDDLRDSQLWLMPRVTIEGGRATVEAAPGRTLDAGPFWMVLDTSTEQLDALPGGRADRRPVVHVSRQAIVVYKRDRGVATGYPWSGVEASLGRLSLDGPELIDFLRDYVSRLTAFLWAVGLAAVGLWQLGLVFAYVGLYRALFYRGLYVPRFGTLVTAACLAALPAVALGLLLLLAGIAQPTVAAAHALASGALFFAAATRVRLGDDRPDLPPAGREGQGDPGGPLAAAPDLAASLAAPPRAPDESTP
jgi:hypothetical protein